MSVLPPHNCNFSNRFHAPRLTNIGNIDGYEEDQPIYGASFDTIHLKPSHFETTFTEIVEAPWRGQKAEGTFMNRTKVLNEPEVETYKYLRLSPAPSGRYEIYEGFGNEMEGKYLKVFMIIMLAIILLFILSKIN